MSSRASSVRSRSRWAGIAFSNAYSLMPATVPRPLDPQAERQIGGLRRCDRPGVRSPNDRAPCRPRRIAAWRCPPPPTPVPASSNGTTITYQSADVGENVDIGVDGSGPFVSSDRVIVPGGGCTFVDANRSDCAGNAFVVRLFDGESSVDGRQVTNGATLTAVGGPGDDRIDGTNNADALSGNAGSDNLTGNGGNDTLDGGAGENFLDDGAGNDVIVGGPQNDTWTAGPGTDTFTPGAGTDTVSYNARTTGVTITLRGGADDGEPGEGDDVGTEAEDAAGGAGNDVIVGNDLGDAAARPCRQRLDHRRRRRGSPGGRGGRRHDRRARRPLRLDRLRPRQRRRLRRPHRRHRELRGRSGRRRRRLDPACRLRSDRSGDPSGSRRDRRQQRR